MIFRIINSNDGNNVFEIEADSVDDAAHKALNEVGWYVSTSKPKKDDETVD